MASRNRKIKRPFIWIPPGINTNWKFTVTRHNGQEDDLTNSLSSLKITDGVTEGIGSFKFKFPNPNETYTHAWTGMEIVRYYADYSDSTPTTLRFRGRIERPDRQGGTMVVTGRSDSLFVIERTILKGYAGIDAAVILKNLFDTYGAGRFNTGSIPGTIGTTLNISWIDKPFWTAVEDICNATGYDCYIDANLVVQFFESGSVDNTTDGLVHTYNIVNTEGYATDVEDVRNKIRVYGSTQGGVQTIYTANDTASQSQYGIRSMKITDENITTFDEAKETGEYFLSVKKTAPLVGEVKGILLAGIQPGETLWVSDPLNGIEPGRHRVVSYSHEIGDAGLFTTVRLNKEPRKVSQILKERIEAENRQADTTRNPDDLDFSKIYLFDDDEGTHSNTEITDGVLKKETSGSDGTWLSTTTATPDGNNVTEFRLVAEGQNLPGATFRLSGDNGFTFDSATLKTKQTISTSAAGKNIKVEVVISDDDTQIDSLAIQFKTS